MTPEPLEGVEPRPTLGDVWRARPRAHARALWAVMLGLDTLPWPWGEDILAAFYGATSAVRPRRIGTALAWAAAHRARGRWPLALALCAFRGRWVARCAITGLRDPGVLRAHVAVRGAEHLDAAPGGAILLGFHLGPPLTVYALRLAGHRVGWLGGEHISRRWLSPAWTPLRDRRLDLVLAPTEAARGVAPLYTARNLLLDGISVLMMGDGHAGREAFTLPIPGGRLFVNRVWLSLRRQTGARVLPVLTHLEGRMQVVTVHPPLPEGADLAACRSILGALVENYVARFPEQCPRLAFRTQRERALGARGVEDAASVAVRRRGPGGPGSCG